MSARITGTGAPPDMEQRPNLTSGAPSEVSSATRSIIAHGPVVAYRRRRDAHDSDARLAGELAAARVAVLEPLSLTPRCPVCPTLGVRELQLEGWQYGGCVHLLEAS